MSSIPDLVVVGTLAFDDIETPAGRRSGLLGGSATYFSVAASSLCKVGLVGVVGADFPAASRALLEARGVDTRGLEVKPEGRTFHWAGRYEGAMDQAQTLATDLNVLSTFTPRLPEDFRRARAVFLANIDPSIQGAVLDQLLPPEGGGPRLLAMDTMNLWIQVAQPALRKVLARVDGLFLNDAEARQLTGKGNLVAAGKALLGLGPRFVIVKKGEHGSFLFSRERFHALPSYPVEEVVDPTGAGDTFAGAVMGFAATSARHDAARLCEAMLYGTAMASFTVSDFSLEAIRTLARPQLEQRVDELRRFVTP